MQELSGWAAAAEALARSRVLTVSAGMQLLVCRMLSVLFARATGGGPCYKYGKGSHCIALWPLRLSQTGLAHEGCVLVISFNSLLANTPPEHKPLLVFLVPETWLCVCADPYVNDATFALSMVFLEELGATGNKVCCCPLHHSCS